MDSRKAAPPYSASTSSPSSGRRPRRRFRRLFLLGLFCVVVLVAAGPTLVSKSPLRNLLLSRAIPSDKLTIRCEWASFRWLGGQAIHGLTIADTTGAPLLAVESIVLDRSLAELLANASELGKLELVRPVLHVISRPDGSNVEDLFVELQNAAAEENPTDADNTKPRPALPNLQVAIVDGRVEGADQTTGSRWTFSKLSGTLRLADLPGGVAEATGEGAMSARRGGVIAPGGAGAVPAAGQQAGGNFKFRLHRNDAGWQQLDLLADRLALDTIAPWFARMVPGGQVSGHLSLDTSMQWSTRLDGKLAWRTNGKLEATQLRVAAGVLQGDAVECRRLTVPWQLAADGNLLAVEQLTASTEWGQIAAKGVLDTDRLAKPSGTSLSVLDGSAETRIDARFDLARLAAMLPHTLRIRRGVRIDSGEVQLVAQSPADGGVRGGSGPGVGGRKWTTRLALENLAGSDGTRPIRWDEPVELQLDLEQPQNNSRLAPRISRLKLHSPFLKATLQTTARKVDGQFSFDLEKLTAQVGQLVDLSPWQLRGIGSGTVALEPLGGDRFQANAQVDLQSFDVTKHGQSIWAEPQLQVTLRAAGEHDQMRPRQITSATVQMRGAGDSADIRLLEPVDLSADNPIWSIRAEGSGPLESWAKRLGPWSSLLPDELRGNAMLSANLRVNSALVEATDTKLQVAQLHVRSGGYVVDEPQVQLSGDGRWDARSGSLTTGQLQLVSSTIAMRSRDVAFGSLASDENQAGQTVASGTVAFRADLERLATVLGWAGPAASTWPRGLATGQVQLSASGGTTTANFSLSAEQLQIVRIAAPQAGTLAGATRSVPTIAWTEPRAEVAARLVYDSTADRMQLDNVRVTSQAFQLQGSATVDKPTTEGSVRANGTIDYDWDALANLLAAYAGQAVRLEGKDRAKFQLAGRLFDTAPRGSRPLHWSQQWAASAEAGWQNAQVYSLPIGKGRLQATLADGMLQTVPLKLAVGGGELTLNPQVVFAPSPQRLIFPPGPLATDVRVSPEMSERMLKYIAPILAGAAQAEGVFSVQLEGARVPLADYRQADVTGRLEVHRLNVLPGPMVQQLVMLVKQIEAIAKRRQLPMANAAKNVLTIDNRTVDFRMVNGRVYHRGLEFQIDNVPVRSSGSVGLDQTLDITFEVPVLDKWVEREQALQPLAGQVLPIRVVGTFQRPKIDQRVVADLSQRMFQGAAQRVIGDEINRQLDKLLRPR